MKKIFFLLLFIALSSIAFAQTQTSSTLLNFRHLAVFLIFALTAGTIFLVTKSRIETQTKTIAVITVLFTAAFLSINVSTGPVGLVITPSVGEECSDGTDNDGNGLIDTADPGCHSDGDATNVGSYVATDNYETASIDYEITVPSDNKAHIYAVVQLVNYINGDSSLLVNCIDDQCTGSTASCVGDVDFDGDGTVDENDVVLLQQVETIGLNMRTSTPQLCGTPAT